MGSSEKNDVQGIHGSMGYFPRQHFPVSVDRWIDLLPTTQPQDHPFFLPDCPSLRSYTSHLIHTHRGIIPGFALGIVLSMFMFIISFAKATARTTQAARQRSRVVRLKQHRRLLDQGGRILTLELTGR